MWKTAITKIENEKIFVRGYDLTELMESCTFGDMILLMAIGNMPQLHQGKVMEAVLVSCCDQGALPPSTNAARFVASCGVPLQSAVAAGILGFGDHHGGAIEGCAKLLQEKISSAGKSEIDQIADDIVFEFAARKERVPGFGHAYLEVDPRAERLLEIAKRYIAPHRHIDLLQALEKRLIHEKGRHLGANINGAVAAAISDLDIEWQMGRGIFIISRSLGLMVHAYEEMKLGKPYKKISPDYIEYIGSEAKEVPVRLAPS